MFATHLGCEVFASSNIFYSIFGTVQILTVLHGVHDMIWVCSVSTDGLGGQYGPSHDQALRDKASDLGPPCSLLVWDVKYMHVVIYFIL